jgi:hypothetical protein
MALSTFITIALASTAHAVYSPSAPPIQPAAYPSTNPEIMISGNFLQDPIIQDALVYVQANAPASLLGLAPSIYRPTAPNAPTYPTGQGASACYWPQGQCIRSATADFMADVASCPNANDWGLTYDDGPSNLNPGTTQLLAALQAKNIKATFYVTGAKSIENPSIILAEFDQGHEIAVSFIAFYIRSTRGLTIH